MAKSDPVSEAFCREWQLARDARLQGDVATAFSHLERAHILGQRRTWLHIRRHRERVKSAAKLARTLHEFTR